MDGVKRLEIYQCLSEFTSDGLYVYDPESSRIIVANTTLERVSGYSAAELTSPDFPPELLIHEGDRHLFPFEREEASDERVRVRLVTKEKEIRHVECMTMPVAFGEKRCWIGAIQDVTDRKTLETKLKEEVALQKRNTIETAKSSVRIYQLTEKIRNVPNLTTSLLNAPDEETLLKEASRTLCEKEGLGYAEVSFYLREEDSLVLAYSTHKPTGRKVPLSKNTAHVKAFNEATESSRGGTMMMPLKSRDAVIGLIEVRHDENERVLFDESESVKQGQKDIVRTIANMVGLMIDNLRLYRRVKQQSIRDELTQTYNRRHFDSRVRGEFVRASRYRRDLSLVVIDIDNFKGINDTWGHPEGDLVLKALANFLQTHVRQADVLCRYGGEEFVALLPQTSWDQAHHLAERLREGIAGTSIPLSDGDIHITVSIGAATRTAGMDGENLLKAADAGLYQAKKSGKNRVCGHEME